MVDDAHQVGSRGRRNALHHNVIGIIVRIRLGDIGKCNLALVQLFFENLDRVVGVDLHRVIDLHLQNQVSPAAQIKAQVDALRHRREQAVS